MQKIELVYLEKFINNIKKYAKKIETNKSSDSRLNLLGKVNKKFYSSYSYVELDDSIYSLNELVQEKYNNERYIKNFIILGNTPLVSLLGNDGLMPEDRDFSKDIIIESPTYKNIYDVIVYEILIWQYINKYRDKVAISANNFLSLLNLYLNFMLKSCFFTFFYITSSRDFNMLL